MPSSTSQARFFPTYSLTVDTGPFVPVTSPVSGVPPPNGYSYFKSMGSNSLTFTPPLTVEFEIRREFQGSAQSGTFRIKNLARAHRNAVYRDQYAWQYLLGIEFRAGFKSGSYLPLIFNGRVNWARSERRGEDWWTIIDAFDGSFAMANSFTSQTFPPNTDLPTVFNSLNGDLIGTYKTPIIGTLPSQKALRGLSLFGPTWKQILRTLPPGVSATIDNNQLKILSYSDAINVGGQGAFLIQADTGLLSPPVRSGQMLELDMIFEPRITLGQLVQLNSFGNSEFNGTYRVNGITHQGTISPDVDGEITTHLTIWLGTSALTSINGNTPQ